MPGRTYAFGDVHGCSVALETLIAAIDPQLEDTLVFLGDFIDYGPDTKGVIELLMGLPAWCQLVLIMGNHEEMLLEGAKSESDRRFWLSCGGDATLKSYGQGPTRKLPPEEHLIFIRDNVRDFFETLDHIFVHAGVDPDRSLHRQHWSKLRWEFVDRDRARPHQSGRTVIVGHTPQVSGEVLDLGFIVLIDTDCSRGSWLTALEPFTGEVLQANQSGELRRARLDRPPVL